YCLRETCRDYARYRFEATSDLTVEFYALRFRVSLDTEIEGHQQQVLIAEASIDRQRFAHCSHHQPGANQQHERKRDMCANHDVLQARLAMACSRCAVL